MFINNSPTSYLIVFGFLTVVNRDFFPDYPTSFISCHHILLSFPKSSI